MEQRRGSLRRAPPGVPQPSAWPPWTSRSFPRQTVLEVRERLHWAGRRALRAARCPQKGPSWAWYRGWSDDSAPSSSGVLLPKSPAEQKGCHGRAVKPDPLSRGGTLRAPAGAEGSGSPLSGPMSELSDWRPWVPRGQALPLCSSRRLPLEVPSPWLFRRRMAALACPAPKGAVLTPGAARPPAALRQCPAAPPGGLSGTGTPRISTERPPAGVRARDKGGGFPRERTVLREQTWAEGPGHTAPRPGLWKSKPGVAGQPVLEAATRCLGSQT